VKKKSLILFFLFWFCHNFYSQIQVNNSSPFNTAVSLVDNILLGGGVSSANHSFMGDAIQIGFFNALNTNLNMDSGIVMSTGDINALDPNFSGFINMPVNNASDPDLLNVANSVPGLIGQSFSVSGIFDVALLEFDFIPNSDSLSFNYIFGSNEYLTWVNSQYNDVFGFFISGPGISGPYSAPAGFPNGSINIATVPNSSPPLPITISSINNVINSNYYINNTNVFQTLSCNGFTQKFQANVVVQCGETYHIRLAIADGSDTSLDSWVFLEAGSFSSSGDIKLSSGISNSDTILYEGCNSAFFNFERQDTIGDFTIYFDFLGTATIGQDYDYIPDSLTIPSGQLRDTLFINPILDSILEATESVVLTVYYEKCSGQLDTSTATLYISDYTPLNVSIPDSLNFCNQLGEVITINSNLSGGLEPISINWSDGSELDSVEVSIDSTNFIFINVTDRCNKEILDSCKVWVQCPIENINIFTPNNDGINDFFVPINLNQYPNPHVLIFNRWGKLVYENLNYQNDWIGTHYKSGQELKEGIYYYIIDPKSTKYDYQKINLEKNVVSGKVQLIR
jgi:gliding motility-associated-like protein